MLQLVSTVAAVCCLAVTASQTESPLPSSWLADAGPQCNRAFNVQQDGGDASALWLEELERTDAEPCPHASSLLGIALARSKTGETLDQAFSTLTAVVKADPADWVAASYLAASYELMARRIAARGDSASGANRRASAYRTALSASAQLFAKAHAARETWRKAPDSTKSGYPQAWFAQPSTFLYRSWGTVLLWAGREAEARAAFQAGVESDTGWVSPWARPVVAYKLSLPQPVPVFTAASHPETLGPLLRALEAALPAIRDEYLALRSAHRTTAATGAGDSDGSGDGTGGGGGGGELFQRESAGLHAPSSSGSWTVLPLLVDGTDAPGCASAPVTCGALRSAHNPLAWAVRDGQAKFSVLAPGTHVKPHAGPSNARLRVHCTLTLLHGGPAMATLRVGTQSLHWQDGACFAFDESFEHEVTTASAEAVAAAEAAAAGRGSRAAEGGHSQSAGGSTSLSVGPDGTVSEPHAPGEASPPSDGRLRAAERAVLLIDVPNPFLASREDFQAHALSDAAAASAADLPALLEAWSAAQRVRDAYAARA